MQVSLRPFQSCRQRSANALHSKATAFSGLSRRRFSLFGISDPKTYNNNPLMEIKVNGCRVYLFNMAHWVDSSRFLYQPFSLSELPGDDISFKSLRQLLEMAKPDTVFLDLCPLRVHKYTQWISQNPKPSVQLTTDQMRSMEHPALAKGSKHDDHDSDADDDENEDNDNNNGEFGEELRKKLENVRDIKDAESRMASKSAVRSFAEKLFRMDRINMVRGMALSVQQRSGQRLEDVDLDASDHWQFDHYWHALTAAFAPAIPSLEDFQREFFMCCPRWRHIGVTFGEEVSTALGYAFLADASYDALPTAKRRKLLSAENPESLLKVAQKFDDIFNKYNTANGGFLPDSGSGANNLIETSDTCLFNFDFDESAKSNGSDVLRNASNDLMEFRTGVDKRLICGGMPTAVILDKIRLLRKPLLWLHLGMSLRNYYEDKQQKNMAHQNPLTLDFMEFAYRGEVRNNKFVCWDGTVESLQMLELAEEHIYDLFVIEQSDYVSKCLDAASKQSDCIVAVVSSGMTEGIVENLAKKDLSEMLEITGPHGRYLKQHKLDSDGSTLLQ